MAWLDNLIVTTIIVFGMVIMYRGLKEPLDMLFGFIAKGFVAIKDKVFDYDGGGGAQEITYG